MSESGILCFYIILKPVFGRIIISVCLVSYAFTSFSNQTALSLFTIGVWYLMLLHHSQTYQEKENWRMKSGILCFYIILKHLVNVSDRYGRLVSYAFTSFSNAWYSDSKAFGRLVSYAFTSFSNLKIENELPSLNIKHKTPLFMVYLC